MGTESDADEFPAAEVDGKAGGEVSLERARDLRDEGESLLDVFADDLDLGDGEVVERP